MRLMMAVCVLMVLIALSAVDAEETVEDSLDKEQEDEEYEDIAVAESQDIGHARLHPNNDGGDPGDRPRVRPRGRKRRRRLRKRPRSTTPSFIEEYSPERTLKEEETPPTEEEVVHQRRRPSKRRRRPMRRKPEFDSENSEPTVPRERPSEEPYREPYEEESEHRPRNPQRRRRKGGRKRIRVSTEPTQSGDEAPQEVTTQPSEVVGQSNNFSPEQEGPSESFSEYIHEETTPSSIFNSAFTPKEITEINHKFGPSTELPYSSESVYHTPRIEDSRAYSPSSIDLTSHNIEENHISHPSTTTKDYAWINRFIPKASTRTTTEEITTPTVTTSKFGLKEEKKVETKSEPQQNIKNIERIIENRKNLLSKTRRLPTTSAVIRRRLRPRKYKNATTTEESAIDNSVLTTNPTHSNNADKPCEEADCDPNLSSLLTNNIVPSALLPSGFPTMPEVLSTAEMIKKISQSSEQERGTFKETPELAESDNVNHTSDNIIIITPSTLVRSSEYSENGLPNTEYKQTSDIDSSETKEDLQTYIPTSTEPDTKSEEFTKASPTELTSPTTTTTQATTLATSAQTLPSFAEEKDITASSLEMTTESENLKLDGVDVTNINDEILELIMDEMGKARVKRILELRNMTLSELIAHRERGAGHFSAFIHVNKNSEGEEGLKNPTERSINSAETGFSTQDTNDEEKTETMIVEKAKHLMNEYKKTDDHFSNAMKSTQKENNKFGKRIKVEGTVIPVPILEPTHTSIQFPDDGILGAFPKYMRDITGKKNTLSQPMEKQPLFTGSINTPREIPQSDTREPRVFESMPKFNSETSNKDSLEISPYPDWRIAVSKSTTEKIKGFPGISEEILLVAKSSPRPADLEDVILLDEGEEAHHLRNHILGGKHNVESGDMTDEDYPEPKKVPQGVKSAIAASGAILGLAIFGFLAVLVSCKIRQRRARLRARQDILCEHLAEDIRGSQRSLSPVLRKSPFNHTIQSNTASNRHYYLWRTLRKTFQYE